MEIWFYFITLIILSTSLRICPHFIAPRGVGVDHWYWKAYIEEYQKNKCLPPALPQFLLEKYQWYPPLFPVLISMLPKSLFDQNSKFLAIGLDQMRMAILMSIAYLLTDSLNSLIGAGVTYALTPILISYNAQLNPRGLAALFLDIIVLLLVWLVWHDGMLFGWALMVITSGLLLLTHKMTTQLFWFLCITGSIVFQDWRLAMLVPASIMTALILSRGFYFKILRAHWDIVSFWNRNWNWMAGHPVMDSVIYREPGYKESTKYFRSGIKGMAHCLKYLVGFNPWGWSVLCASLWMYGGVPLQTSLTIEDAWMAQWLGLVLFFAVITTFIPFMRCLGNGYLYVYNAAFPAGLLVAMIWGGLKHGKVVELILYSTFILCLLGIGFYFWKLKNSKTQIVDSDLNCAIEHLKNMPSGVVLCFPQHWHDLVAYKTKKSVLWGTHGFGFKMVEPIFPVILKPISVIIKEYNVTYLLTYDGYLPKNFIDELPTESLVQFGAYHLHSFK